MKTNALILSVAALALSVIHPAKAEDSSTAIVKEGKTFTLAWDHVPDPFFPETKFAIYTNGVFAQILTTNQITMVAGNGTNTFTAQFVAGPGTAKDQITLTTISILEEESLPSDPLTLYTLGKPKRPEKVRKQ